MYLLWKSLSSSRKKLEGEVGKKKRGGLFAPSFVLRSGFSNRLLVSCFFPHLYGLMWRGKRLADQRRAFILIGYFLVHIRQRDALFGKLFLQGFDVYIFDFNPGL